MGASRLSAPLVKRRQGQRQHQQRQEKHQIHVDCRKEDGRSPKRQTRETRLFDPGIENASKQEFLPNRRQHDCHQPQRQARRPEDRLLDHFHRLLHLGFHPQARHPLQDQHQGLVKFPSQREKDPCSHCPKQHRLPQAIAQSKAPAQPTPCSRNKQPASTITAPWLLSELMIVCRVEASSAPAHF